MKTLVGLIQKMVKKYGVETTDNVIAGMLLVKKDYFSLMNEVERYLKENE